jgi:phosphorylcholine metabolism protein LicD
MCTVHLYIVFSKNLCNLAKYKFLKLCEDDTEVSKHVGVNIIRENIVIDVCALVGYNKNKENKLFGVDRKV